MPKSTGSLLRAVASKSGLPFGLLLLSHTALGDSAAAPNWVLTPARVSQPQGEVPASVTVIDRQLIQASGARELYQVFRLVPGMSVAKADGNVPEVAYHGTQARDQRRMLVLLDGRSQYQPAFARINWNDLPVSVEDIERIEVTRGPAAASYGANAFSGVINIITRDARDLYRHEVSARRGNNGVNDARIMARGGQDQSAWFVSYAQQQDDGYDKPFRGQDRRDAKHRKLVNAEWVHEPSLQHTFRLQAGASRVALEREADSSTLELGTLSQAPDQHTDTAFMGLSWQADLSPSHQLNIRAYAQYSDQMTQQRLCFFDPLTGQVGPGGGLLFSRELRELFIANNGDIDATLAAAPTDPAVQQRYGVLLSQASGEPFCAQNSFDANEKRYDVEIQDTWQINDNSRLVSGLNVRHDRVFSRTFLNGSADNTAYRAFGNLAHNVAPAVTVNLGAFWEYDDISNHTFSPRAGLNWQFIAGHYFRTVYSQARRNPDIYEDQADIRLAAERLDGPFRDNTENLLGWSEAELFSTRQSPGNLHAERIDAYEIGYFGIFRHAELDVRLFHERLRDLISGPLNVFRFEPENSGEVDLQGAEFQLAWRPHRDHRLWLVGAYINIDTEEKTEQRFSARKSGSALWQWHFAPRWNSVISYYTARDYHLWVFERAHAQLNYTYHHGANTWQLFARYDHDLTRDPVLFRRNQYRDDVYWLGLRVAF